MEKQIEEAYDEKGNAKHYDDERINVIVKMEKIWGTKALITHCEITAFKYRSRIGKKPGQPIEQELLKAQWYEKAAAFYLKKVESGLYVDGDKIEKIPLPWSNANQTSMNLK